MATYINRVCHNSGCESHKLNTPDSLKPYAAIVKVLTSDTVKCETCGNEFEGRMDNRLVSSQWGKYNASAGEVFNSYSEQRAWEKKTGSEPI